MDNQQINTFDGGMNMDLDNDKLAPNQYSFAENFRHTVNSSNSLGSLEAVYGNIAINSPSIPGCIRYSIFGKSNDDNLLVLKITTTTNHILDFSLTEVDHTLDEATILSLISNKINSVILAAETNPITPMPVGTITYMIDGNSFVLYGDIAEFTTFTNLNPSVYSTFKTISSGIKYYIGATEIRDKALVYVITTYGANALILYEEKSALNDFTITSSVKYVGDLGFNLSYPILDSAINYESSTFCKVYFTDGNQPLKHVNVFYPTLMAKNESFLDLISNTSIGNIKISNIYNQSSTHKCGRIQYSFQYYNENGQESTFSNPSNMVDLTIGNFNGPSSNYSGGDLDENANKQVKISLSNLDQSFERFRLVSIFYSGYNSEAIIKVIHEDLIPLSGEFEFIDANSTGENITTDELVYAGTKLIICKTLDVKNNLLLLANIKDKYEDYSDYDTRVYRFNEAADSLTNSTKLFDTDELTILFSDLETTIVDKTKDCKLPKVNQFEYKYGKNKSNNAWMLGGSGNIISYNFVRAPMSLGNKVDLNAPSGFIDLETYLGDQYPNDNLYLDLTSPIKSGVLSGYMRNEVYRFGIEFYDLKGRKSFVNWIGDIKFPAISEIDETYLTIGGTDIYDYRTSFVDRCDILWAIALGIEFHVDSSKLPSNISGYSIVRVNRSQSDKTEIAQGLLSGEIQGTKYGTGGAYTPKASYYLPFSKNGDAAGNGINGSIQYLESAFFKEFISPEISYRVIDNADIGGKNIDLVGWFSDRTGKTEYGSILHDTYGNTDLYGFYDIGPMHSRLFPGHVTPIINYVNNLSSLSKPINNSVVINPGISEYKSSATLDGVTFNYGTQIVYGPTSVTQTGDVIYKGVIGSCAILDTDDFNLATVNPLIGNPDALLIANISSSQNVQYGGNSYYARSNNEYISCNHVKSTHAVDGIISDKIFGGDTYVSRHVHIRTQPRDGVGETTIEDELGEWRTHYSESISFIVESSVNTNISNSTRVKVNLSNYNDCKTKSGVYAGVYTQFLSQTGADMASSDYTILKDAYTYNTVFSRNSGLNKFQAKPINLNENEIFDSRILSSRRKYNGESTDNWLVFDPSEFIDLQNKYGPINKLINFGGQVIALQDSAIGIASVDEKAIAQDVNSPGTIILGTGGILKRYDYVSTSSGTKHQSSVCRTPTAIYYHDSINSKSMMFSGQENSLSESKGVQSLLNKFKSLSHDEISRLEISGITRSVFYAFNPKYREIEMFYVMDISGTASIDDTGKVYKVTVSRDILNLIDISLYWNYDLLIQNKTELFESNKITAIVKSGANYILTLKSKPTGVANMDSVTIKFGNSLIYNELVGAFSGFITKYPIYRFNINGNSYEILLNRVEPSIAPSHELYRNDDPYEICKFYGNTYSPKLSYTVNQDITSSKVFDAISMGADIFYLDKNSAMIKNPISRIRCYNTHYNSGWMNGVDHGYTFGNRNEVMVRKFEDRWSIPIPRNACKYTPDQIIDNSINILDDDVSINFNRKFREKIDGKYLKVDMIFNTFKTNNIKKISWKLMNIVTGFRIRF